MVIRRRGLALCRRTAQFSQQSHLPEQRHDTLATAVDPDVDVTGLTGVRVGIEPCVGLSLQDGCLSTGLSKQPRQSRRLRVLQLVQPADGLRLSCPLHGHVHRQLVSGRHRIEQANQCLPSGRGVNLPPRLTVRNCREGLVTHRCPQQRIEGSVHLCHLGCKGTKKSAKATRLLRKIFQRRRKAVLRRCIQGSGAAGGACY